MGLSVRMSLAAPLVAALTTLALAGVSPVAVPASATALESAVAPGRAAEGATADAGSSVPGAVRAPERLRVVNHNIEKRAPVLRRALAIAKRSDAEVVTLQEVCAWQALDLRRDHPGWTISYKPERSTDLCRSPARLDGLTTGPMVGNVTIWTGGADGDVANHTFGPQRVTSDRTGLACVSWVATVRHRACSVHLISPTAPEDVKVRTAQAKDVRRITGRWVRRGDLVVLAGDFNAKPHRRTMRHLYARRGVGRFREASSTRPGGPECRCARSTYDGRGVKIDYVFFSANRTAPRAPRRLRIVRTLSDHHLLVGWADLDVSPR